MSQTTDRTQSTFTRGEQQDARQRNREEMQTGVVAVLDRQREKFEGTLPDTIKWDEFRACFLTAVQRNWRLLEADRDSLWLALQDCANMGLRPDGKEAALVIFGDDEEDEDGNRVASKANQKKKVVLLPMVWGLCRLVHNTGNVADVRARCVYAGEHFKHWEEDGKEHYEYRRIVDPNFDDDPAHIIGAFGVIEYKDGSFKMDYLSRRQIERRRAVSRAKKGPWGPWYDEQAMKTVLKHVFKSAPKSRELQRLEAILDRDESLPTIEGERPTEIRGELADHTEEVRAEFTGDAARTGAQPARRSPKPALQTAPKPPANGEDPNAFRREVELEVARQAQQQAAAATNVAAPYGQAAPATQTPERAAEGDNEGFEAWLVDHEGVETRQEPYTDPVVFVRALAKLCAEAGSIEEEREILGLNEGAVTDAGKTSEEAARLIDGIIRKTEPPAEQTGTEWTLPPLLELSLTPKGQPYWPNYIEAAIKALDECPDKAAADAWIAANRPTWDTKSLQAETRIGRHYRAKFGDEDKPRDRDADVMESITKSVAECKHPDILLSFWSGGIVAQTLARFAREEKQEQREAIRDLFTARNRELTGRDGMFSLP